MADTATASSGEPLAPTMGPVQLVMYRRLRTIQKRLQKIENAEKKRADGGEIDEQQEELIAGKPQTLIMLDEFTRLTEQVTAAVHEERAAAVAEHKQKEAAKAEKMAAKRAAREPPREPPREPAPAPAEAEGGKEAKGGKKPRGGRGGRGRRAEESTEPSSDPSADAPSLARRGEADSTLAVEETARRILSLLYFARVFDLTLPDVPPFSHALERRAALSYHGDPTRPVTSADLDFVCALGRAMTDRPPGPDFLSHGEAIEACVARAVRWVKSQDSDAAGANETIPGTPGVSFDRVRAVVERIAATPFNALRPVMIGAPAAEDDKGNRTAGDRDEGRVPLAPAPAAEGERREDPSIPPGMGGVGFFEMLQRQQAQQPPQMQHQQAQQPPQMQMQPPQMQPQFGQFAPPAPAPAPAPALASSLGDNFGGDFGLTAGAPTGTASHGDTDPKPADGTVVEGEKPRSRGARGGKKTRGGGGGGTSAGAGGRAPASNVPGAGGEERRGRVAGTGRDNGGRGGGRGGRGGRWASGKRE